MLSAASAEYIIQANQSFPVPNRPDDLTQPRPAAGAPMLADSLGDGGKSLVQSDFRGLLVLFDNVQLHHEIVLRVVLVLGGWSVGWWHVWHSCIGRILVPLWL